MLRLPVITVLLFAPIIFGSASSSIFQAPITPTGVLPISTPVSNVQSHNQFYTRSHNQYNATTRKPSGTWGGRSSAGTSPPSLSSLIPDFAETCVLWNTSCSGNKTHAMDEFFTNTSHVLYDDVCFLGGPTECLNMTSSQKSSRYGQVKDWMRSPQCYSDYAEWTSWMPTRRPSAPLVMNKDGTALTELQNLCCSGCAITAGNVDIYYWPEANASTSCLSINGNSTHPLDYGATTDATGTYWGCTGLDSSLTKTAHITTINSISQKVYLHNPWSPDPCSSAPSSRLSPTASNGTQNPHPSIFAGAQSLITKSSIQNTDLPIVTAVIGSFTFTSPSIYANFHNLATHDICGDYTTIVSTMLTFTSGELSTWAGQLTPSNEGRLHFEPQEFNFQDLPCPPQSVMERNWYKPQEGEPYRPLIAIPSQIKALNSGFATCGGGNFFSGIDPPRSLTPATVMVPITTSRDPKHIIETAMPSPSLLAGAEDTATDRASTGVPSHTPTVEQAKETNTMMLDLKQGVPDPQSHVYDPVLIEPQVKTSTQPGLGPLESSSKFLPGSSVSDNTTPRVNQNIPKLPYQTVVSVHTIVSSDPGPNSTPTSQGSDPFNGFSTVTGPKPSPPFAHIPATVVVSHDRAQDPSRTDQDPKPHTPQIAGVNDPNTLRTVVDPVPTVDYQYHVDHSSNLIIAPQTAQAGEPVMPVAGLQIDRPVSANNIAAGNRVPIEASALVATTVSQSFGSSMLENIEFTWAIPSIETRVTKTYSIASQTTGAATIPAENVLNIPLIRTLDITTGDGTLTIPAIPGHLPITGQPGAPGLSDRTKSSESLKTQIYGTRDHSTLDPPTGKVGSISTNDHATTGSPTGSPPGSPTGRLGSISTGIQILEGTYDSGDHSTSTSPTGSVESMRTSIQDLKGIYGTGEHFTSTSPAGNAGSTSTGIQNLEGKYGEGDHSTSKPPTSNVGSTSTGIQILEGTHGNGDNSALDSPTSPVGSTSSGIQILEGTSGTVDHSTFSSPTGKVGSTSTRTQILEGRARSWKDCVGWKKAGLTGLLIGILM